MEVEATTAPLFPPLVVSVGLSILVLALGDGQGTSGCNDVLVSSLGDADGIETETL